MNLQTRPSIPSCTLRRLAFAAFAASLSHAAMAQAVTPAASEPEQKPGQRGVPAMVVTATPGTPSTGAADEIFELSPFIITAEEDKGYVATSTLGGTRLRTDLKDVAASISVVTKEMMDDLAVDGLDQLANYTLGTEVGGLGGNFSDTEVFNASSGYVNDEVTRRGTSTPAIRVRGLSGGANRTRDYFITDIPGDRYNVERIDVQRGPNGMLYGLGSPSGVVNEGAIKANLQRNRTNVSTRVDHHGSYRGSLDHNHVLLKDKLGLRVATVYNRQEFQIEEAFDLTRRAYGTLTFRPLKSTTLRLSGETATIRANPPRTLPPYDFFSHWWDVGMPVYNANTGVASYLGTPPADPNLGPVTRFVVAGPVRGNLPSLVVENAANGAYGLSIPGSPEAVKFLATRPRRNPANTAWIGSDGSRALQSGQTYIQQLNAPSTSDPTRPFWRRPQITDPAIFDFFHHQLDGDARSRDARWNTFNVAIEQQLGRNAGLELAYDRQDQSESFSDWLQFGNYTLKLDLTTTLVSGLPNPNFGRPFVADVFPRSDRHRNREAFRATAYYDLDLKRLLRPDGLLAKILGRHTFTGNYTWQTNEIRRFYGTPVLDLNYWAVLQGANAGTASVVSKLSTGPRQINGLAYVGPSVIGTAGPQNVGIQPVKGSIIDRIPDRLSIYNYPSPPASATVAPPWGVQSYDVVNASSAWDTRAIASQATHTRDVYKSAAMVAQSRWFENTLVSTVGWRRDWVNTFDAGGPIFDSDTGQVIADPTIYYPRPRLDQQHDAFNYGLVLHTPGFIQRRLPRGIEVSLAYNRSDNFSPQAERFNVYGQSIDPTAGSTDEIGAIVSLFDRKVQLRATHYETASTGATESAFTNGVILAMDRQIYSVLTNLFAGRLDTFADGETPTTAARQAFLDFLRNPVATPFYSTEVAGYYIDASGQLQGSGDRTVNRVYATSDVVAKGWEFDVTANPTPNWRVSFNVGSQSTVKTNSGNELAAMLASWKPFLADGPAGDLPVSEGSTTTLRDRYQANWLAVTNRVRALNGSRSPEQREWRFNFINNFSFTEGRLKGWNIGGALRWQDKVVIGYPITVIDGGGQFDVHNPFWGPAETNVDGWIGYGRRIWKDRVTWKAQLNVRNIGVQNRLIPVTAGPDGRVDTYRIAAGMTWALTNSFSF